MSKAELITLGSDPELFLEDDKGKVISAIGKIGGTKDKPLQVKGMSKGFCIQEDNVLLEYNTPPATRQPYWVSYQQSIREYLAGLVGQLGLRLSNKASHSMDDDQLDSPTAWVFGCDPDYDVWAMRWNKKPKADDEKLRSAGGHIHVCYSNPNMADSIRLGRILDYFVGAPLAALDPDENRQKLYGKPGAIRFKPYGLEYRTPSNFWTLDPRRIEAVWYNVNQAVLSIHQFDELQKFFESARYFLENKKNGWDDRLFCNRGMFYHVTDKDKKIIFKKIAAGHKFGENMTPEQFWNLPDLEAEGEENPA